MDTEPAARTGSVSAATDLADGWWAPALALHERARNLDGPGAPPDESSRARPGRWRDRHDAPGEQAFRRRLGQLGLDEAGLLRLLAEPATALAARSARPWWARTIEEVVHAVSPPPGTAVPTPWRAALAWPLRPLVSAMVDRLVDRLAPYRPAARFDLPAMAAGFAADLSARLVDVAAPTFVAELHAWREAGRLRGADGRERFADFVRRLSEPAGLGAVFAEYPVLARLLAETGRYETDALVEMLTRFAEERGDIVRVVCGGTDPGALRAVGDHRGDPHQRGRSVRVLSFADGSRVVYKPRGIRAQLRFAELVDWLNAAVPGLALRTPAVLGTDGHGWMEFVAHTGLTDTAAASAYHRRLGALLALLHVVHATDMHCENVVAAGDQPVVVDAETLFHPNVPVAHVGADPAVRVLAASVARTSLLPSGTGGVGDVSALAGSSGTTTVRWESAGTDRMRAAGRVPLRGEGHSRPRLAGRAVEPRTYQADLLGGFHAAYDAAAGDRKRLLEIVRRCRDLDVRVVVRPTGRYRALLEEAGRPEALRDGLDRDRALDPLWTEAGDPLRRSVAAHEAIDLWSGDIPLFHARPGSRDLWASDGRRLPDLLDRPEGERVAETIAGLGEVDRQDQKWIIKATMATRCAPVTHRPGDRWMRRLDPVAAPPQRLLSAACEVADRIIAAGISDGDRVNWLGLEPVDELCWLLLPAGAGLAHGHLGVALFLAEVARLSGVPRYAGVARLAGRSYPELCRLLADQPGLVAAVGCGGLSGLGGMAYGLARLAALLGDRELAGLAGRTVDLAATAVGDDAAPDWTDGLAGCLAAMLAVHRELGSAPAWRLAERCADLLVPVVREAAPGDLPDDFARGWAGVGHALHRMADRLPRYRPVAARAMELVPATTATDADWGWCSGAAGRLLATGSTGPGPGDVERTVRALAGRPVSRDLSLCHGELGLTEALVVLAGTGRHPSATRARNHRAGLVLDAVRRHGPICGTPDEVVTPGLLTGLAGIGYGLLRLGFAAEVPSVLLLQPAERGS